MDWNGRSVELTEDELHVIHWAINGKRDKEIAGILGISRRAVGSRIERAMNRLGAITRTQLGAMMVKNG